MCPVSKALCLMCMQVKMDVEEHDTGHGKEMKHRALCLMCV